MMRQLFPLGWLLLALTILMLAPAALGHGPDPSTGFPRVGFMA